MLLDKHLLPCSLPGDISYQEFWLLSLLMKSHFFISTFLQSLETNIRESLHIILDSTDLLNVIKEDKPKFIHLVKFKNVMDN